MLAYEPPDRVVISWRPRRRPHAAIFSSSASMRAKPPFAPSSTPYCIVVSRCPVVSKRIVCVSFVCSPRSSNSSVCRWFWKVYTRRVGRLDLAELALHGAERRPEPIGAAGADVHLLDDGAVAPPFGNQLGIGPDAKDVRARCVEDPLDADLELARGVTVVSFIVSSSPARGASRSWPRRPWSASSTQRRPATSSRRRGSRRR